MERLRNPTYMATSFHVWVPRIASGIVEQNTYAIFDINAGYEVPDTAATLQLSVNNLFDTGYRSFPGVPKIGRFAMVRVRYELF